MSVSEDIKLLPQLCFLSPALTFPEIGAKLLFFVARIIAENKSKFVFLMFFLPIAFIRFLIYSHLKRRKNIVALNVVYIYIHYVPTTDHDGNTQRLHFNKHIFISIKTVLSNNVCISLFISIHSSINHLAFNPYSARVDFSRQNLTL